MRGSERRSWCLNSPMKRWWWAALLVIHRCGPHPSGGPGTRVDLEVELTGLGLYVVAIDGVKGRVGNTPSTACAVRWRWTTLQSNPPSSYAGIWLEVVILKAGLLLG